MPLQCWVSTLAGGDEDPVESTQRHCEPHVSHGAIELGMLRIPFYGLSVFAAERVSGTVQFVPDSSHRGTVVVLLPRGAGTYVLLEFAAEPAPPTKLAELAVDAGPAKHALVEALLREGATLHDFSHRYRVLRQIGTGASSRCFEVADVKDADAPHKCVKVSDSVEGRRQLRHEADVLRQLRGSPGVVQSHGLFEFQSEGKASLALVLDLYDGSLRNLCEDPALIPEDQAAPIVQQLLGALSNVHAAGFLHRDVKPGNCLIRIMPNQKLELVLADFGLACRAQAQDARRRCGTVGFCAPEMLAPNRTPVRMTNKADIFSAGMTVLYLLTKEPPFGTDADALFDRNRNVDIPAPTRQLSAPCLQLLAGLSHGRASHRWSCAVALEQQFLRARHDADAPAAAAGLSEHWLVAQHDGLDGRETPELRWAPGTQRTWP